VLGAVLIVGAALFVKPSAPNGKSKPIATIVEYGRYGSKGQIRTETNRDGSGGGTFHSDEGFILLEQTDQIPCRVGEIWGVRIRYADVPTNQPYTIRQETHHPPIKQPDGSVRTKDVYETKVPRGAIPAGDPFYGWRLLAGSEHQLVAGEWSFVVFIDGAEVARKSFHLRK
jgi:hypothetical protein